MRNDSDAAHCPVPATDFLGALEDSGILSQSLLQQVREGLVEDTQTTDGRMLAGRLVQQGTLTDFQARRLLVGKGKSLVFGATCSSIVLASVP